MINSADKSTLLPYGCAVVKRIAELALAWLLLNFTASNLKQLTTTVTRGCLHARGSKILEGRHPSAFLVYMGKDFEFLAER